MNVCVGVWVWKCVYEIALRLPAVGVCGALLVCAYAGVCLSAYACACGCAFVCHSPQTAVVKSQSIRVCGRGMCGCAYVWVCRCVYALLHRLSPTDRDRDRDRVRDGAQSAPWALKAAAFAENEGTCACHSVCARQCVFACVCVCVGACMCLRVCMCVCISTHACVCVRFYVSVFSVCVWVCICLQVYACTRRR